MFSKKGHSDKSVRIDSLIGANVSIDGAICFSGGLRVDGVVKGSVSAIDKSDAVLVVSETGVIEGQVCASRVIVNGKIKGEVVASDVLDLRSRACVEGDISYSQIEIHTGAVVQGKISLLSTSSSSNSSDNLIDDGCSKNNVTYLDGNM